MIRSVLRAILEALRYEWRMQRALARMERVDDAAYARDTADLAAFDRRRTYPDPLIYVSSLNAAEVGRQAVEGDAIKDVVLWLECSGWYGEDLGELQCYAVWLLRRREKYERGAEVTS